MIPKVIHYCWFGGNPLPKLAKKCIKSWKKYCPDYKIVRWDESNYDISDAPLYVRQAYEAKKWAFVTDYVRLQVVYDNGGIYLDTDVELLRSLDCVLDNYAYFGIENEKYIATGLGFGAEAGAIILQELMQDYAQIPFIRDDGTFDQESCVVRNTRTFLRHGFSQINEEQLLLDKVRILPMSWLCPLDYWSASGEIAEHTLSIHHFSASWMPKEERMKREKRVRNRLKAARKEWLRYLPNRAISKLVGESNYQRIRSLIKRK